MDKNLVIEQLIKIYMTEEWWHKNKLSLEESWKYFKHLLINGNIVYKAVKNELVGYAEFYLVNDKQVNVLNSSSDFFILNEDITNGNICYVSNIWIKEGHRGNGLMRSFKKEIESTKDFDYYSGNELKNNKRLRVWEK